MMSEVVLHDLNQWLNKFKTVKRLFLFIECMQFSLNNMSVDLYVCRKYLF